MGIVSPLTIGGTATVLQINTDDADALWNRALSAGAEARQELAESFWGELHSADYRGRDLLLQRGDPFGHRWNIAQRLRDVPHAEIVAAAAEAFGGG